MLINRLLGFGLRGLCGLGFHRGRGQPGRGLRLRFLCSGSLFSTCADCQHFSERVRINHGIRADALFRWLPLPFTAFGPLYDYFFSRFKVTNKSILPSGAANSVGRVSMPGALEHQRKVSSLIS